ncbi:malonyl-coenzyme:anthocyanin 5-O-glucoside-6'''-O-malonyltransferase-like [Salvia miltiorrhiza]|uniref:malonyl-coenzyme:anthocyanin 5-O-glucoside-6'''-O-malonyltransferase-like n=1 Tax=Salvia miltiorrhiza TaxID=226208 RepID=UPI0025ACC5E5|nr:malonyl-coenzyme:anthocyanin 5-O-glucoside-6'''-O-malonyltransferase-like [Salvia miltiorrhiza]
MTTVLETCRIPPAPGGAAELSLPLTYLDVTWIHFQPIRRLLFYDHPCSKPQFLSTIVPHLKQSLSLTLKHYLPVAGSLLYPSDTAAQKPVIRYVAGDSVPLTIAVSTNDLDHLTGNHPRDADQFYDFVPPMPPASDGDGFAAVPVFALQATLFPGRGVCIGFANHHVLGDASSIVGFVKAWASITKLGGDAEFLAPVFDRGAVSDPHGWDMLNWEVMREIPFRPPVSANPVPTNRVRATFVLNRTDLERLKRSIKPGPVHVSSFAAATSYVWSCMAKSGDAVGEEAGNGGVDYFVFVVDVRARADPPVPASYFGNCLSFAAARVERRRLAGEEGFAAAAEEVGRVIGEKVNRKEEVLRGMQNWRESYEELKRIRSIGVSGSPRFDLCAADFGWGEARKMEALSIDGERYSMSLCKSRGGGGGGGLEVGLSLEKERMEAFAAIFAQGLRFG